MENSNARNLGKILTHLKVVALAIIFYGTTGIILLVVLLLRMNTLSPLKAPSSINTNTNNVTAKDKSKEDLLKEAAMVNGGDWLRVSQVAKIFDDHPDTITAKIRRGEIKGVAEVSQGEHYKIPLESLIDLE